MHVLIRHMALTNVAVSAKSRMQKGICENNGISELINKPLAMPYPIVSTLNTFRFRAIASKAP
jgi:hypothetical protein